MLLKRTHAEGRRRPPRIPGYRRGKGGAEIPPPRICFAGIALWPDSAPKPL